MQNIDWTKSMRSIFTEKFSASGFLMDSPKAVWQ